MLQHIFYAPNKLVTLCTTNCK